MPRFSIAHLILATLLVAIALAVTLTIWKNTHIYSTLIGWTCMLFIPKSPFLACGIGLLLARHYTHKTKILFAFIGVIIGVLISIACYLALMYLMTGPFRSA